MSWTEIQTDDDLGWKPESGTNGMTPASCLVISN